MSGKALKAKAETLTLRRGSKHEYIRTLIIKGFFDLPRRTQDLINEIRDTFGKRLKANEVQTYMRKFMAEDIVRAFKFPGHQGNFWVLATMNRAQAARLVTGGVRLQEIGERLFSEKITKQFGKDFSIELEDLHHNFGKSGTCVAFLLRKILEKLIYLTFAKQGRQGKLEDKSKPGGLVGLETMITIASGEKVKGTPFITPKTAKEIKGIKFLGDTAAHNPLVNVDMKTIIPQMPFIITAYEELLRKL